MNTSLPLVACFSAQKSNCQFRTRRDPCSPRKPLADLFCNAASSQGSLVVYKNEIPSLGDVLDDFLLAKLWSKFSDQFTLCSVWYHNEEPGGCLATLGLQSWFKKTFAEGFCPRMTKANQQIHAWGSLIYAKIIRIKRSTRSSLGFMSKWFLPVVFCYLKFQTPWILDRGDMSKMCHSWFRQERSERTKAGRGRFNHPKMDGRWWRLHATKVVTYCGFLKSSTWFAPVFSGWNCHVCHDAVCCVLIIWFSCFSHYLFKAFR